MQELVSYDYFKKKMVPNLHRRSVVYQERDVI